MGWDKGRYYTRLKKVNGRVVRQYIGTGRSAERLADLDASARQAREAERVAQRARRAELDALDAPLDELNELAARAALVAAGFRQHHRGAWRKSRVQHDKID